MTAFPVAEGEDAWSTADGWERFHDQGGPADRLTISSDGGGCLPVFDAQGELQHMDFATSKGLPDALVELLRRGHALDEVLPALTSNVAQLLRLHRKGRVKAGLDADLVVLGEDHRPLHVMARGQWMVRDGRAVITGTFEE
jgi:beta-aspartyl-dipeptidase (metallo-type)